MSDQTYKGNGEHDWELVHSTSDTFSDRLRVPGGWLYRVVTNTHYIGIAYGTVVNTVFVPMPEVVKHKV
jgi:hypothetical protein